MATHPGDGSAQSPVASLVPLKFVAFNVATSVPGSKIMMLTLEAKAVRLVDGQQFICPQPFYNRVDHTVVVEDREYPMDRVHYFIRAKMALSKDPAPMDHTAYTVGKRAPERLQVTVVAGKPKLVTPL